MSSENISNILKQMAPFPELTEAQLRPIIHDLNLLSQSYSRDLLYTVRKNLQIILVKSLNENNPGLMVIVSKILSSLVELYTKEFIQEAKILLLTFPEIDRMFLQTGKIVSEKLADLSASYSEALLENIHADLHTVLIWASNEKQLELIIAIIEILFILAECYPRDPKTLLRSFINERSNLLKEAIVEKNISADLSSAIFSEELITKLTILLNSPSEDLLEDVRADLRTILEDEGDKKSSIFKFPVYYISSLLKKLFPLNEKGSITGEEWQSFQHPFLEMRLVYSSDGYLFNIVELITMGKNEKEGKYLNPYTGVCFSESDQECIQQHPYYIIIDSLFKMYSVPAPCSSSSSSLSDDSIFLERLKKIFFLFRYDKVVVNYAKIENTNLVDLILEKNYVETFKFLVFQNYIMIDAQDGLGRTVLHLAVIRNKAEIVAFLLMQKANTELLDQNGFKARDFAINANKEEITFLLAAHAQLKNGDLNPVFVNAVAISGYITVMNFLLDSGFDVDDQDSDKNTVLNWAVFNNQLGMVKFLLDKGADIFIPNKHNKTSLTISLMQEHMEIIAVILDKRKESIDIPKLLYSAYCEGKIKIIKFLLSEKIDINVRNIHACTVLHYSVHHRNGDAVRFFLEQGADINSKDGNENTALYLAITQGYGEIIDILLENKADIETELESAVRARQKEMVRILLEKKAWTDFGPKYRVYLSAWTGKLGDEEILQIFLQQKWNLVNVRELLFLICKYNVEIKIQQIVLNFYTNVDPDPHSNEVAIARFVWNLSIYDDTNIGNIRDWTGRTALHWAAAAGRWSIVKILLDKGLDVNCKDNAGATVLDFARQRGPRSIVHIIEEYVSQYLGKEPDLVLSLFERFTLFAHDLPSTGDLEPDQPSHSLSSSASMPRFR